MDISDPEFLAFAIENHSELFGYIVQGNLNIRIHQDITGEMWFGVGWECIDSCCFFKHKIVFLELQIKEE